jgi:hypothetical protein
LSTAVIVTSPVLVVAPAAIVSVLPLSVKSPATAGDTAPAVTVTVVAELDARSSVAVTMLTPPSSSIDAGASTSVTIGVPSSSLMVSASSAGPVTPWLLDAAAADTRTSLSGASTSLSTAVIVTPAVADVAFAAKLRVVALIVTAPAGAADTVTSKAVADAGDTVAVNVLVPSASEIEVGASDIVTVGVVGASSSSVMVSVTSAGAVTPLGVVPDTVTV